MLKKNGFMLLEILVASAISGFILTALFVVLKQANNNVERIARIASIDTRQLLVQNQLDRDLSGAFVIYERKAKAAEQKEPEKVVANPNAQVKAEAGAQAKKEQYEDVPLKKVFFSKNSGDNLELLTFITNNPLKSFPNEKPKPLIARVVYKLVRDTQQGRGAKSGEKISFKLFRQEGANLSFDEFEKANNSQIKPASYEVVKNIKKISVEYTVAFKPEQEKDKDKKNAPVANQAQQNQQKAQPQEAEKEEKVQYKTSKSWTDAEIKSTKKQRPDLCKFTIEFWDDIKKTYKTFEFKIYIYTQESKTQEQKPQEQKPQPKPQVGTQNNINLNVAVNKNSNPNGLFGRNLKAGNNNTGARNNSRINTGGNNIGNINNRKKPSFFDKFFTGNR